MTFAFVLAVSASLLVVAAVGYAVVPARAATTIFTVTSTADSGSGSLRQAISDANAAGPGPNTINFDPSLTQGGDASINLSTVGDTSFGPSALVVTSQIEIDGPTTGENGITVARSSRSGTPNFRLFYVKGSASNLVLKNLTLSGGLARGGNGGFGGAIFNLDGGLTAQNSTFADNTLSGGTGSTAGSALGSGIYSLQQDATATLALSNDLLANSSSGSMDCENNGGTATGNNNLIKNNAADNAACAGVTVMSDPKLGPLADNGGPTFTQALQPGHRCRRRQRYLSGYRSAGRCPSAGTKVRHRRLRGDPAAEGR